MQKTQKLLLFALLFITSIAHAQWGKVLGRNAIGHESTSFSKYQSIICSNGANGLYYTRDNGANWKLMRPSHFKAKDTIKVYQSVINELGIFALVTKYYIDKKHTQDDSTFLFFTPNFGATWEKRVINTHTPLQDAGQERVLVQNKDYIYAFVTGADTTRFDQIHAVLRYTKKLRKWENLSAQYPIRPSNFDVTEAAEYVSYYGNDTLAIRYNDGRRLVTTFNKPKTRYELIADSLMFRLYADNTTTVTIDPTFSKDFGKTWYRTKTPFPSWKQNPISPYFFTYKNKLFVATDAKIYSSVDKGLNWTLESTEMQKYEGFVPKTVYQNLYFHQDSVLLFNIAELSTNIVFGYNMVTKKAIAYTSVSPSGSQLSKLPDGRLIADFTEAAVLTSSDKGNTWTISHDYPYYFNRIPVNDNTFYVRTSSGNEIIMNRFVNGLLKDTINFFPRYDFLLRSNDTIVTCNSSNAEFRYAKSPFDKWTIVPNQESRLVKRPPFSFKDNSIFSLVYNSYNGEFVGQLMSIKLDGTTYKYKYVKTASYLNISTPKSIWFVYQNGSVNTLANSVDSLKTWKNIFANPQNNNDFSSFSIVNQKNIPLGQILLLNDFKQSNSSLNITSDGGKTWGFFNNGFEKDDFIFKTQQIDDYLFAFTNNGLYRRPLADINLRSVSGKTFHDLNGNKIQDAKEPPLANVKITSKKTGAFAISDTTGFYSLLFDTNSTDTLTASFDNKSATINPAFYISTKSDTAKNFAIQFTPNIQDLRIDITALTPPRGGFLNTYILNVKNVGSVITNSKVTLQYNGKQNFVEASTAPTSNVNQVLTWNFATFQPNESKRIEIQFKTAIDAPIRSEITNIVGVEPIVTDNFKDDNTQSLSQVVVGSYDPNDKQVVINYKKGDYDLYPNAELIYTIRFQNTGNYPADFVRVVDTLSDILDISTLKFLSASHEYKTNSSKGRVLVFDFNPIYLPDSTANEAKSHGFIKFSIKPKRYIRGSETINNTAYIYFDYNPAIITNTIKTHQIIIGIKEQDITENLQIYPNPAQTNITFAMDDCDNKPMQARIYSMEGRLLRTKSAINHQTNVMDVSTLGAGVYLLRVQSACKNYIGKFIVDK